jgi:hypothetical protein
MRSCATCAHRRGFLWNGPRCGASPPAIAAWTDPVTGKAHPARLPLCALARDRPFGDRPEAPPRIGFCGPEGNLWAPRPRRWADIALRVAITLAAGAIGFVLARAVRQGMGW